MCVDFPVLFINEYGGCDGAGQASLGEKKLAQRRMKISSYSVEEPSIKNKREQAKRQARQREQARQEKQQCLTNYDLKLKQNSASARRSQSSFAQDDLRYERRELMSQRRGC
jgi:hypothetical protein